MTVFRSTFGYLLEAVQDRIKHLGLVGIASSSVLIRKLPWDTQVTKPAVLICPVTEQIRDATNCQEDYGYGIQVTIYAASGTSSGNRAVVFGDDDLLRWRQLAMAAFVNQRIETVAGAYQCKIEPGPVVDPVAFGQQHDATSFVVRCWTRQTRGTAI